MNDILVIGFAEADAASEVARLRRVGLDGCVGAVGEAADARAAVVAAAAMHGAPTLLGDLRRAAPDLPVVLVCDEGAVDVAVAALHLERLELVAAACSDEDYAVALAALRVASNGSCGAAEGDGGYALRLAALGEEIARIARAIEPALGPAPEVPEAPLAFDPELVRGVLRSRRRRDALFAGGLFGDPVWDMLLDLTAARGEGTRVSVSSLAIAAAVPTTTALRHLKAMVAAGLVVRRPDFEDGRRTWIDLSDDAFARMRAWVADLPKSM